METLLASSWQSTITNSFEEVMDLWQSQPYATEPDATSFRDILESNPMLRQVLHEGPCLTAILNLRTRQYDFVSNNIKRVLGYSPQEFLEGGIEYQHDLLHPDDSLRLWKLMRQVWNYLLAQPRQKRADYRYNCDYRLKKANGSYVRLLEQNTILQTDQKGNITHLLRMCTDITTLKKGDVLTASVVSDGEEECLVCTSVDEHLQHRVCLSRREKEIVQLLAAGYSSKLIADKLCISCHTVNTHRRNIIEKTNTRNTGELILYAMQQGLL